MNEPVVSISRDEQVLYVCYTPFHVFASCVIDAGVFRTRTKHIYIADHFSAAEQLCSAVEHTGLFTSVTYAEDLKQMSRKGDSLFRKTVKLFRYRMKQPPQVSNIVLFNDSPWLSNRIVRKMSAGTRIWVAEDGLAQKYKRKTSIGGRLKNRLEHLFGITVRGEQFIGDSGYISDFLKYIPGPHLPEIEGKLHDITGLFFQTGASPGFLNSLKDVWPASDCRNLKAVVLTQPLAERDIPDRESFWDTVIQALLEIYSPEEIGIKPHPREESSLAEKYGLPEIPGGIPFEYMLFAGSFSQEACIVTPFSTAGLVTARCGLKTVFLYNLIRDIFRDTEPDLDRLFTSGELESESAVFPSDISSMKNVLGS